MEKITKFSILLQELEARDDCDRYLKDKGIKKKAVPLLESINKSIEKGDEGGANDKIDEFLKVFSSRAPEVEDGDIDLEPLISNFQPKLRKILKELKHHDG